MAAQMKSDDQRRIVVVDDDPSVVRALARLIRLADYVVQTFESAEAFLEGHAEDDSDCLILDVHLPGLSGVELQARLRDAGSSLPIIFITAFDSERVHTEALEAGASAFLKKPLDGLRLLDEIARVLGEDPATQ